MNCCQTDFIQGYHGDAWENNNNLYTIVVEKGL